MENLFRQMVMKDLQKMNDLVLKGWYDTEDFNEAVLTLSNSLTAYHQEVNNESCKKGELLQESWMAEGA